METRQPIQIRPKNEEIRPQVSAGGRIIYFLSFILIIPIFMFISKKNHFKRAKQSIEETASGIDVQLKKRHDVLIKLVETTKQYIKYEKDVLTQITNLRTNSNDVRGMDAANATMDQVSRSINVQLENYPDLKASNVVTNLQMAARDAEDDIAASRRFYNSTVRNYNQDILVYPGTVVSTRMNLHTEPFFEASQTERQDVKMDLY